MTREKYVAIAHKTRAWTSDEEYWQERPTMQLIEESDAPIDTGLFDAHGTPLYRVRHRGPVGFCR